MNAEIFLLESAVRAAAKLNGLMLRKALVKKAKQNRPNLYGLTEITTNARIIGHKRMGGRGVSLEVCAQILSERDPSFQPGDLAGGQSQTPAVKHAHPEANSGETQFERIMDQLIQKADDELTISRKNYVVRMTRMDQIMRKLLGDNWEFYLSYDFAAIPSEGDYRKMTVPLDHYGKLRGESIPAMFEKLDRQGKLKPGLRVEEIQAAAARENELRADGEEAGRACAAEGPPPKGFRNNPAIPNNWLGAVELGVAAEYEAYGKGWFEGFICGALEVWKSLPPKSRGNEGLI